MTKKPAAGEETKKKNEVVAAEKKPAAPIKARTSKPATNPFVQQHPRSPGKSAAGGAHRGK